MAIKRRRPFPAAIRWTVRVWILCAGAALAVRLVSGAVAADHAEAVPIPPPNGSAIVTVE